MDLRAAAIAANRFGFGARPGELKTIASDPRGWLKSQMKPQKSAPAQIAALPPAEDDIYAQARSRVARQIKNGAAQPQVMAAAQRAGMTDTEAVLQDFRGRYPIAVRARLEAALTSTTPAFERQVHFWSNHFTVSAAKNQAAALPPSFERDAIRPNVCGSFATMLSASTQHPGMLIYLDNWQSIGPNSDLAKNPRSAPLRGPLGNRARGLNENLGREILELHTLGVNGGYSQADVIALAKIITGWTFERERPLRVLSEAHGRRNGLELFTFEQSAHEPGPLTLLGRTYPDRGQAQGAQALADLAHHPSTAKFIATKLVRHYIADDPPAPAIARVTAAFQKSGGDLADSIGAVIDSPEAWAEPLTKFKQPEEYLISVFRALNLDTVGAQPQAGAQQLVVMGQPVYRAPGPNGWDDSAASWLSADLVWKRLEWVQLAAQRIARADIDPIAIGENALGPLMSEDTKDAIRRAQSPMQAFSILFASPEFQRR